MSFSQEADLVVENRFVCTFGHPRLLREFRPRPRVWRPLLLRNGLQPERKLIIDVMIVSCKVFKTYEGTYSNSESEDSTYAEQYLSAPS